ncbi:hypothetical protein ES288_D03G107000v1 [Gossypium darwinii]|uniref:Uncharacterized protein n=1 Tax=Gossypium darwinii TaxID=34276 RepID=A0A5D2D6S5_GOSDA|nr:hypothetical protein ES288_D03G107000v1 [Gossypium darwinii]
MDVQTLPPTTGKPNQKLKRSPLIVSDCLILLSIPMASLQGQKPVEKTCCPCPQHGYQKQSTCIGYKMSEMASSIFKGHGQTTQCHSQTGSHHTHGQTVQCHGQTGTLHAYGQIVQCHSQTGTHHTHGQTAKCHGQTGSHHTLGKTAQCHSQTPGHCKRENQCTTHKNGHASGGMACQGKSKNRGKRKRGVLIQKIKDAVDENSSSDSESDDEKKCGTRKASLYQIL